jgi:Holliday junction resolvase-like predicted endonuclease
MDFVTRDNIVGWEGWDDNVVCVCGAVDVVAYISRLSAGLEVKTKYEYMPNRLEIVALVRLDLFVLSFFAL